MSSTEHHLLDENAAAVKGQLRKFRGDAGMVPVIIGFIFLVAYFQIRNSVFLTAGNITNLFVQSTVFILMGMAEIWLLLLGEIDLSIGYVAGLGAAVAVITATPKYHWNIGLVLPLSLLITTLIGVLHGTIIVKLRLPSFIVTLAGLLGWEGVLILLVDHQGTGGVVPIQEKVLYSLVSDNLTVVWTWIFIAACVAVMGFLMIRGQARRRKAELAAQARVIVLAKLVILAAVGVVVGIIFSINRGNFIVLRGMPFAVPIDVAVLALGSFILTKTKAGRYIYAIGGNAEAARRAGINVDSYRLVAFAMAGFTAGIAGLLYASRLGGVSDGIDGGTLVLYAVAAAVIGGTSLFGGRGRMVNAVIGGLIIATIYNGMALLSMSASAQYVATALVLLAAVTVDSLARRGNDRVGR